jgi:hypothetical protein
MLAVFRANAAKEQHRVAIFVKISVFIVLEKFVNAHIAQYTFLTHSMYIQNGIFLKEINQIECTIIFFYGRTFYQGIMAVEVTYCSSAVDFPLLAKKDLLWQKPPLANFCTEFCRIHAPSRHIH